MDLSYVLFDTQPTGTAVFDALLFQTAQGGDVTHTEDFTNMRGAGSLPSEEKFMLERIGISNDPAQGAADFSKLLVASLLQIRVNNQIVFWSPLPALLVASKWTGYSNLTAAAGLSVTGSLQDGYTLDKPIQIDGGRKFDIRIKTTQATAVSTKLVIHLFGTLSLP